MKKIIFITILAFSFVSAQAQNSRSVDKNLQRSSTTFPAQLEIDSDPSQPSDDVGIQNLDPNYGSNIYLQNDAGSIGNLFLEGSAGPFFGANSLSFLCDSDIFIAPGNNVSMSLNATGNVGIGTTGPFADRKLSIISDATSQGLYVQNTFTHPNCAIGAEDFSTPGSGVGVLAFGGAIGIHGVGAGNDGFSHIGVYGAAIEGDGTGENVGVFGEAANGLDNFAGGFVGDVITTGNYLTVSDAKLKTNVQRKSGLALTKINKLNPAEYEFKDEYIKKLNLPVGLQHGFIAQELQEVFPELINETKLTKPSDKDSTVEFMGVNYIGLIPVLTEGIQELSAENNELKERIAALEAAVEALTKD